MPAEKTRLDSVREYLTGASGDGGTQSNQALSLGNFRSSTEALSYGITVSSPIANITIIYASGGNNAGAGSLQCIDANTLQWKDAGGTYGIAQSIANGETKILENSVNPGAYIRITRTSATGLVPGTATVTLTELIDNVFSGSDVTASQASTGITTYRATMLRNEAAGSVTGFQRCIGLLGTPQTTNTTQLGASGAGTIVISGTFADWPGAGFAQVRSSGGTLKELVYYTNRTNTVLTVPAAGRALLGTTATAGSASDIAYPVPGLAIGEDSAGIQSSGASIQTIANETTAPTGISWSLEITNITGINFGNLGTTQQVGCWFKRVFPAGTTSQPNNQYIFQDTYDAA